MTTPRIIPPKEAAAQVERQYPNGTLVRHKASGDLYVVGVRRGSSSFFLQRLHDKRETSEHANRIILAFEKVKS